MTPAVLNTVRVLATVSGMALAGAAYAQPPLEVYDNEGRALGRLEQSGLFARQYAGGMVSLTLAYDALQVNATFLFTSTDCTGPAYTYEWWDGVNQPRLGQFDGHEIWTSDTDFKVINVQSSSWFWNDGNGKVEFHCDKRAPFSALVANPVPLETAPQWAPVCSVENFTVPSGSYNNVIGVKMCKPVLTVK